MPIVAMAVGISAMGEQVEDGTIVYTWTRPCAAAPIYLGRRAGRPDRGAGILSLSLVLCFLVMMMGGLGVDHLEFLKLYLDDLPGDRLGRIRLHRVFAAMGTWFQEACFTGPPVRLRLGNTGRPTFRPASRS